MRSLLMFAMALAALPAQADDAPQHTLLVLDFKHDSGDASAARLLNDVVATAASRYPTVKVVTGSDLRSMAELEANKQVAGCDVESSSCLAEIANAMGANLVMFGSVGRLGEVFLVTINLFDSVAAQSLGRESVRVRDESALPDEVDGAVVRLMSKVVGPAPAAPPPPELSVSPLVFVGAGVAVVGAAGAAAGLGFAAFQNAEAEASKSGSDREDILFTGQLGFWGGVASAVVGVAGVVIAVLPLVSSDESQEQP